MRYLLVVLFALMLTGCEYIEVSSCDNGKNDLRKGDLLSNDTDDTYIQITQSKDSRQICVSKGSAHIFRK